MEKKAPQVQLTKVIIKMPMNPPEKSRILVALILIYYIWILLSAWSMYYHWGWNTEWGLYWTSGGPGQFIPIPRQPGWWAVITPAYLHDYIFYLVFMHNGIWIIWVILGFLFLSPYRVNFRTLYISIQAKLRFRRIA